jgi:hypothetical protein
VRAKQRKEDRRRDVIRKVARDAKWRLYLQGSEVDSEEVSVDERDVGIHPRTQMLDHRGVDFDCRHLRNARREPHRQCAGPRPDFEKPIRGPRFDCRDHFVGPCGFQEMLAELLLRPRLHHTSSSDSPRQYFSSISSISSSLMPK